MAAWTYLASIDTPVQNLSKDGEGISSVNAGILPKNCRIKYKTVEDAAEYTILLKRRTGELIYFSKFDHKAAYRLLLIHPSYVGLLGVRDNEEPPGEWVELRSPSDWQVPVVCTPGSATQLGWVLPLIVGRASSVSTSTTSCKSMRAGQAAQPNLVAEHAGNIRHLGNALERQDRLRCGANYLPRIVDGLARRDSIDHRKTKEGNPKYAERLVGRLRV
jgi:hypothetical protein